MTQLELTLCRFRRAFRVRQLELAIDDFEHRDVRAGPRLKRADLVGHSQERGAVARRAADDFRHAQSQMQELAERRDEIKHRPRDVVGVQVAADVVGQDALLQHRAGDGKGKAARAVTDIQQHALALFLAQNRPHARVGIQQFAVLVVIAMSQHITRTHRLQNVRQRQPGEANIFDGGIERVARRDGVRR